MMRSFILVRFVQAVWLVWTVDTTTQGNITKALCKTVLPAISCEGKVPEYVPNQVHTVNITNLRGQMYYHFAEISAAYWTQIEYLTIECMIQENENIPFAIPKSTFSKFSNLRFLRISCRTLIGIHKEAFNGLGNLSALDLSDSVRLSVENLTIALEGNILQSLQQMILRRISIFLDKVILFSDDFFYSLQNKPIRHLDLSGTKLGSMHIRAFAKGLSQLTELNVSEGGFLALNFLKALYRYPDCFQNLRKVDVSFPSITDSFYKSPSLQPRLLPEGFAHNAHNFTSILAMNIVPNGMRTHFVVRDEGSMICNFFYFLSVDFKILTFCLLKDGNAVYLKNLNIAHNGLEDIDNTITFLAIHLKYLDMSHNRLSLMPSTRFERILYNAPSLTEFFISHNSFSHIPYNIFISTLRLQVIDLSHNNLVSITFKLSHLDRIRNLKLDHNKIHTIFSEDRVFLDNLIRVQITKTVNSSISSGQVLIVDIRSNPLACSCDNKEFVEWVLNIKEVNFSSICFITGDRGTVQSRALSRIDFLCKLHLIIVGCSVAVFVLLILGVMFCAFSIRRRLIAKQKQHIMNIIKKYKSVENSFKYPVFLSFSSFDGEFIDANVVNEMNSRLQELLETNNRCVATGDTTFRPGFYVLEEIIKWIECSEVIVLCISKNFCKSPWCIDEMFVSHYEHKPMVLMFLEEVKTSDMPKVLRKYFSHNARSKWVVDGNSVNIVPCWETVCNSIVQLMTTNTTNLAMR